LQVSNLPQVRNLREVGEQLLIMEDIYYFTSLDQIKILRIPTRWEMLNLLVKQPMTSAQIARQLGITRSLAHYHLKVLENADLVIFQEERISNGMVEKYYRAQARQYRSDHLVDQHRISSAKNETGIQTGEAVGELMKMMLEIAQADLARPDAHQLLAKIGFNFQDELRLTHDQVCEFIGKLRRMGEQYIELDRQNHEKGVDPQSLVHLRFTWLMTPITEPRLDNLLPTIGEVTAPDLEGQENLAIPDPQELMNEP
jgi:DNA-binding transcriptional ArsR family regulator